MNDEFGIINLEYKKPLQNLYKVTKWHLYEQQNYSTRRAKH